MGKFKVNAVSKLEPDKEARQFEVGAGSRNHILRLRRTNRANHQNRHDGGKACQ